MGNIILMFLTPFAVLLPAVLPEYYEKVLACRRLMESGKFKEVSQAVKQVGISRSTYYKYKDYVLSPSDVTIGRKAVLSMVLSHEKGALSRILNLLASFSANILTLTQALPINEKASVTISLDIAELGVPIRELIGVIENTGVAENVKLEAVE